MAKPGSKLAKAAPKRIQDGLGKWTALTPEFEQRFFEAIEGGDWPFACAYRCGASPNTVWNWLKLGAANDAVEPYASFTSEVLRIEGEYSAALVRVVTDAALGIDRPRELGQPFPDPNHAKWLLINRFRGLWKQIDQATGGANGGRCVFEVVEEQLMAQDTVRSEAAREVLKQLPAEAKVAARKSGFMVPA